jgi:hypothetical protein
LFERTISKCLGKMGWVWNPVKARHNRHNLSAVTDTLFLSIYESIAVHILLGAVSNLGKGWS